MKRCAFLTLADPTGYVIDDELAIPALAARGWQVDTVPWTAPADWAIYDVVIIRSTWDYQHHLERFLDVLGSIEASGTRLENPAGVVRWNTHKSYLRELEARGMSVVPTLWEDDLDERAFPAFFEALGVDELVVKPQVGANAGDTLRVRRDDLCAQRAAASLFAGRDHMVQPFLRSVTEEGEYSLIMFDGEPSHAILKTPRAGDFRVQEEHGGIITRVEPAAVLLEQARAALRGIDPAPLYARVDLVRLDGDRFGIMEVELVEPALYFRMDPSSPERFAAALDARTGAEAVA